MQQVRRGEPPRLLAAGAHGGDGHRVAAALGLDPATVLDLSASLNPFAPPLAPVAARHLGALGRYPDPAPAEAALAAALGVDPDSLVLTNGGAEAIALVAAEVGGGVASEPEFALHPRAASGPRWRSDPHNPSGRLAPADERHAVRDEAFYALATGCWTRGDAGAWVVGSLTKTFACPGLRLGYVLAPTASDAAAIRRRRGPWSVGGLAVAVVPDLLAAADLPTWAAATADARHALVAVLRGAGLDPEPSDAPWVLVRAPGLRSRLAPHGVVVRDCASFGRPDHVRIAVPDAGGLARLGRALEAVLR